MPELPEVETIARGLALRLAGRRVLACRHVSPHLLREAGPDISRTELRGHITYFWCSGNSGHQN